MSVGLLALLDDIAAFTKIAAASLDDVAGQAAKATVKAAGAVIDDAAVTPNYVQGFAAERELPIVFRIARGSIRNKLLILLPAALVLTLFLPWAITPLLMFGGAYLSYEGAEKVFGALFPHQQSTHEAAVLNDTPATSVEDQTVAGAIQTDFILSAEIMTIVLATLTDVPFWQQALVLALAGIVITLGVYGVVALIVKADDVGLALATKGRTGAGRGFGRGLVVSVPYFMQLLSIVGTAAMIWVGGGIIIHGLGQLGFPQIEHALEWAAEALAHPVPDFAGVVSTLVTLLGDGLFGLLLGLCLIPIVEHAISPLIRTVRKRFSP